MTPPVVVLKTQAAVIGGGVAGCLAALRLAERGVATLVIEKAHINRSGCLAAGVNALNAYVGRGRRPADYVDYAWADAHGLARRDLLLTMAERLNRQADFLASLGLKFLVDEQGRRLERGWRNVQVAGGDLKPLLAAAVEAQQGVTVLNRTLAVELLVADDRAVGLAALDLENDRLLLVEAQAIVCATGGAAGLYRPSNPGGARGQSWYCPFNAGGGLAMGALAGAEMTTLEMRFVALRCRDTLAPTGSLALGAGAAQVNALGRGYEDQGARTTSGRVLAFRRETQAGRGPCRLEARVEPSVREEILRAYLHMSPAQTLKWLEEELPAPAQPPARRQTGEPGRRPQAPPAAGLISAELESSEPYVQGGHVAGGYWVDTRRRTTLAGLWAAGDVAGGAPQKYVTGAMAEAELAAEAAAEDILGGRPVGRTVEIAQAAQASLAAQKAFAPEAEKLAGFLARRPGQLTAGQLEEALQKTMDVYAGGLTAGYRYSRAELAVADERLAILADLS
ncbi:MAG: FAD-dependent oxidoreductase, partial [Deltaproteobacteria bacterium]|nr:FAD-dependent oxidoreductase [Deltaproteobacteria bacterium]